MALSPHEILKRLFGPAPETFSGAFDAPLFSFDSCDFLFRFYFSSIYHNIISAC